MIPNEENLPRREDGLPESGEAATESGSDRPPAIATEEPRPDPLAPAAKGGVLTGLAGFGVAMMLIVFIASLVRAEWTWPLILGAAIGGLAILGWFALHPREVIGFLATYWLALYVVFAALGVLVFYEGTLDSLPVVKKLPFIIAVPTLTFVAVSVGMLLYRVFRGGGSTETGRAGVAANVAVLLVAGTWVLVLVNAFGVGWLSRSVGSLDTTETGVYSLGDRTRGLLAELDGFEAPVYATYLDFGTSYMHGPRGQEPLGERAKDFLKQYGDLSPLLVVKVLDAVRDKAEAEQYLLKLGIDDTDLGDQDTVIFTYQGPEDDEPKRKDVVVNFWSFIETSQLGTQKFKGEQLFTSAIQDVLFERRKVYFMEGHGEHPLTGSQQATMGKASDLVTKLALEVDKFEFATTGRVPGDADLVVLAGPKRSLLPEEAKALISYLDGGGALILLAEPQMQLRNPTGQRISLGIEDYLKDEMGIDLETDHQVMMYEVASGSSLAVPLPTEMLLTSEYSFHAIVEDLRKLRFPVRFVGAAPVMVRQPDDDEGLEVEELVYVRRAPQVAPDAQSYGARLFPQRDVFTQDRSDLRGVRISIAAAAERDIPSDSDTPRSTRVVVFGDSDFATSYGLDERYQISAGGNPTLFSNAVSWAVKRESLISIEPKTLERETVDLTDRDKRLAKAIAIWGIPLFVLFFAIRMAIRRRR